VSAIRRLADEIAVRDVVLGYARAVDAMDVEAVARCFTPDCAYEGALASGTITDALATLRSAFARYTRTMHFMGTQDARVDGDVGEVLTYCTAYHIRTDGRHATVGVRPHALCDQQLAQRIAAGIDGMGRQKADEQVGALDGGANPRVVAFAGLEIFAIVEDVVPLLRERKADRLDTIAVLGRVAEEYSHWAAA